MDGGIQRAAAPSGPLVLRQDTDADVRRYCAAGEGENPSGVNQVRARGLSDEVLTYTLSKLTGSKRQMDVSIQFS